MRALLLATAGVIGLSGAAMANGWGWGPPPPPPPPAPPSVMDHYAAALGVNLGLTAGNGSTTGYGQANRVRMNNSFGDARGVVNVNQNAGANSAQQNAVAVAYVEGCDCIAGFDRGDGDANAVAVNAGAVVGNYSANGVRHWFGGGTAASAALVDSFTGARGIAQVNQNAGANSLQQNATAAAYADQISGDRQTRDVAAIAVNAGIVTGSGNISDDYHHTARGRIDGSFGDFRGVANVNQNVGANSLQQNSAALSAVEFCDCAAERDLATTIAAAGNIGGVVGNYADADAGVARVSMTDSFNGMRGIAQVNQNAGANSLAQNAVAVGAVYNAPNAR